MAIVDRLRLTQLARLHSIQVAFTDTLGRHRVASNDALIAVLAGLGVRVRNDSDVRAALEARLRALRLHPFDVVKVTVAGEARRLMPRRPIAPGARASIRLEDGTEREVELRSDGIVVELPPGYHRLNVAEGEREHTTWLLSAPLEVKQSTESRRWALFAPLYSLWTKKRGAIGDLADALRISEWAASHGASAFATLPMLASYLDEPFDPSPYAPVSRLFWNELYADLTAIPEMELSAEARRLAARHGSAGPPRLVDYREEFQQKRVVLSELSHAFFSNGSGERRARFEEFLERKPLVRRYARFRALTSRLGQTWPLWPDAQCEGDLDSIDVPLDQERYHLYSQWVMDEQMERSSSAMKRAGCGFYLDFPLGSNSHGFDVWHERDLFVRTAAIGAPPDLAYAQGQNWGFRPPHPDRFREEGYRHIAAALRHQMQHASLLRLDHVMGLHRMYWVPDGFSPTEGVYVRNRAAELYAVLAIESARAGCEVVGEDLGTVPPSVRISMETHGVKRLFVLQRQLAHLQENPPGEILPNMVASLNTHDMHPFAAFWESGDIDEKLELGVIARKSEGAERSRREKGKEILLALLREKGFLSRRDDSAEAVTEAAQEWLAASDAAMHLVNVEDLWFETIAQNVPTTTFERPNWRPRLRMSLEEIFADEKIARMLQRIARRRRRER